MQNRAFEKLGVMIDCSRNAVLKMPAFQRMVDILSSLGYDYIRLYTEDTYEVEGEPFFGYMRGKYTAEEIRAMDAYAKSKNMQLIPGIQTLAHLGSIFRYAEYTHINDADDILLVGDERTYKLIDNIFRTLANCFTSRVVNIGMDEAFKLGRGKYLDKNGLVPSEKIMRQHLNKVLEIADKYGFTCEMWGDMFIRAAYGDTANFTKAEVEKVRAEIPSNLRLVCWDYYHTDEAFYRDIIDKHAKLTDNVSFASGAWSWLGFCPNNSFSIKECQASVAVCKEKGIKDYCVTVWGDNGGECSPFGVLPTLFSVAEFAKGNFDEEKIKAAFQDKFAIDFDLFCALEKPDKIYSTQDVDTFNPSKVQLYADVFAGVFDYIVKENTAPKYYAELSKRLKAGEMHREWGTLFRAIRTLSDVLEIKFELGLKTRRVYKGANKAEIIALAQEDYGELLVRLEAFYQAYEALWMKEKKPQGFDVQDARIGGLIRRVQHCRERLLQYAEGKIETIEELNEEITHPLGHAGWQGIVCSAYSTIFSVNVP